MVKLSLLFSDIEAGAGTPTDDFIEEELFCNTIKKLIKDSKAQPTDLILNGDTFDFLKAPYGHIYPRHVTQKVSIAKLDAIITAHPKFFSTFANFLKASKTNRIVFIVGNHDYDIIYPKVQRKLRSILTKGLDNPKKRVVFSGFEFTDGLLHVEHGSQLDAFFRVNPKTFVHPGTKWLTEPFLLLPWGVNALYDVVIHIKERYPLMERLYPKEATLSKISWKFKKELVLEMVLYFMKSFFITQFSERHDPLRRFRFADLWLYLKPFFAMSFHLNFLTEARKKLKKNNYQVMSVGHNHTSSIYKVHGKTILNTGNWRDEYFYSSEVDAFLPKLKSYGYVLHEKNKILSCELREVGSKQNAIFAQDLTEEALASRRLI